MQSSLKANQKLIKDLYRLKERKEKELQKKEEQDKDKYITFKGYQCRTHDEIDDVYRYDSCTNTECDEAHERLDQLLQKDITKEYEIYLNHLRYFLFLLETEIEENLTY